MLDVFDEPKAVHMILEKCAGGELFERIVQKGHYSEQDAARVVQQVDLCQPYHTPSLRLLNLRRV
jgi:hypothetical protein